MIGTTVKFAQLLGFLASECFGVALLSNQGNSPLRSENTGFHFALVSAKLPALRSVETPTPNPCEVRECSLFLDVTFAISNHRITYNSVSNIVKTTTFPEKLSGKVIGKKLKRHRIHS